MTTWTNIPNPTLSTATSAGGVPIGLLLALTYADSSMSPGTNWTNVANPSGTTWTNIPNAV